MNKIIADESQTKWTLGSVVEADLANIKCPCGSLSNYKGTPILDKEDTAAFCAACGTATCSNECHQRHIINKGECSFHLNFEDDFEGKYLKRPFNEIHHCKKYSKCS